MIKAFTEKKNQDWQIANPPEIKRLLLEMQAGFEANIQDSKMESQNQKQYVKILRFNHQLWAIRLSRYHVLRLQ